MGTLIRLYSDFVCPFCFIAEQSVLAKLSSKYDIEVDWRGFELHPETPVGGMPLAEMFPGEMLDEMNLYMKRFAHRFGIEDVRTSERLPNTRKVLAIAEFARDRGRIEEFRDEAMNGYWREGLDLENHDDLHTIISRSGLDPESGLAARDDEAMLARVDGMREEAGSLGVTGIPTFLFSEETIVEGCQPYEVMEAAAREIGATRQSAN